MRNTIFFIFLFVIIATAACKNSSKNSSAAELRRKDSLEKVKEAKEAAEKAEREKPRTAADIKLDKDIQFEKYTLEDVYPYEDTTRIFQFDKIKEKLAHIENFMRMPHVYGVLDNYKNRNGEAAVVENFVRNAYKRVSDTLGNEKYQSAPLYQSENSKKPSRYGRDGSLVAIESSDTLDMVKVTGLSFEGTWYVPKRYVKSKGDSVKIAHVAVVDVTNQNICVLERTGENEWKIRSMNPATSGRHKPPHAMETPLGIFFVQEQKAKMFYFKDGTKSIEGYAPYASRFTNGGYIHGVPVNNPKGKIIEYSWSLGTTPRSHMCVRNASSHAKYVYDNFKPFQSLVVVID
ncbi:MULTISPECIES: L,D-transpeptidase [Sphingobacterium]|uniref:L,D-transpeptidase family protein n=1 Tax=Sphingobacterium tenebrionis TaxID=3111775 RepID=A0ABU8I7B8_9SPHI|nr:L,D-transpeptidase family protein [Sphingobacterium sp. CZ-2]QBR11841.1 murein L,D-transpeptidase [Sphingobacterium sp. CZ-2]